MSFKEFDLSEYILALEEFKTHNTDDVIRHWGSIENFNEFIEKIKADESNVAKLAVKQFGSVEKYTAAMKYNLEHFSEIMEQMEATAKNSTEILQTSDGLFRKLTADLEKDISDDEVQNTVREIITFTESTSPGIDMGEGYWDFVIESYSHDIVRETTDKKYGPGSSAYIAKAFQYHLHK